jgi:hypothetical protein
MYSFQNRTAVIATMHQKEKVIAPLLEKALGLHSVPIQSFDTDQFGTFSGEIERPTSQLETLRMKCRQGFSFAPPDVNICIASEGAFGAHPTLPFIPLDIEMVMLIDKEQNLEVVGQSMSTETNFAQIVSTSWEEIEQFASQIGFPSHALIIKSMYSPQIFKGINQKNQLENIVYQVLKTEKCLRAETDMRAMYNPTRMKVIQQATENLIDRLQSPCPQCGVLGFGKTEVRLGLPCANCSLPTTQILANVWECANCHFVKEILYPTGQTEADPMYCSFCNP